jgi:uncharacterized membrane protein
MIIVDCMENVDGHLTNYFYFVSKTEKKVVKKTKNEMHVQFQEVKGRKVKTISSSGVIARIYFGELVDSDHKKETYAEVLNISRDFNIEVQSTIDKNFLQKQ